MAIQDFGNAFKATINRDGDATQKALIDNNTTANFYNAVGDPAYHNYAANDSAIIDAFYNADGGGNSQLTAANLRGAGAAGGAGFTYTVVADAAIPGIRAITNVIED